MAKELNILAISYAKRTLEKGSREQERMLAYAHAVETLTLIVFTRRGDALPSFYSNNNLTIYATNTHTRIGMLVRAYFLGKTILKKSQKKWIVSSQDPFYAGWIGHMLARYAYAHQVQIHSDTATSRRLHHSFGAYVLQIIAQYVLKKADAIRVVSERIKNNLVQGNISPRIISIVPIEYNLSDFLEVGSQRVYTEQKLITFLYVGRLSPEKNIKNIITSFARARQTLDFLKLHIVGSGPDESMLRALVVDLGIAEVVVFTPWTNAVTQQMAQADVFVCSSYHEGYGMTIAEAMASGLPVISTDVGCVGEVCKPNVHGIVTEAHEESYTQAITTLATSSALRKQYGTQGYRDMSMRQQNLKEYVTQWKDTFASI